MLQIMREKFMGKFALIFLILIGVSFVFFGLNYSFIGSSYAAKVDGEEISPALLESNYRSEIQRNPEYATLEPGQRAALRGQILSQLITDRLVENYLNEMGYRITDEQVAEFVQSVPEFQVNGVFDINTYREVLRMNNREPLEFEAQQRAVLRQEQFINSLRATALVTPAEYRRYLNLFAEQRVITVASIDEQAVTDEIVITDDMITSFYDNNPTMYQLPESADVEYIELRRDAVAESIAVSEAELLQHYEESQDRYLQDEQRQARHILILFNDDEDAAEALAGEVLARVQGGESFEDVAAEVSDDGGTSSQGGDLGTLTRTQLPGDLGGAIFSMTEGEIRGPVESEFGFHIVRLDRILDRGPLPLDQVRAELLGELREREADLRFRDLERDVSNGIFDNLSLAEIAENTGLEVQTVAGFTRSGGGTFAANQAVIDAVFDGLVLSGDRVSDIVEVDANRSAVFNVVNHNEATRQPIEDVRDQIVAQLTSQQADIILAARAEQLLAAIDAGEDFGQAAEASGFSVAQPQLLTRTDQNVDSMLLFDVFAAGKPDGETPLTGRVRSLEGGYSVYTLDAVLPGRPESIPVAERDERKLFLAQQSGYGDLSAFMQSMYNEADIVINDDLLAADNLF